MAGREAVYFCEFPQGLDNVSAEYPGRILFADFRAERPGPELGVRYERSGLADLPADLLILRGRDEKFAEKVDADHVMASLVPPEQPVLCLTGSTNPALPDLRLHRPNWAPHPLSGMPSYDELRAIELRGLLAVRGAILGERGQHFAISSGSHVEHYLRLKDIFATPEDNSRIADWILAHTVDGGQIVLAHRGLVSLELALKLEAMQRFGWELELFGLPPYERGMRGDPHVPEFLPDIEAKKRLLVIGVDSEAQRARAMNIRGFHDVHRLCLVDLTYEAPASRAFVHIPIERHTPTGHKQRCPLCRGNALLRVAENTEELHASNKPRAVKPTHKIVHNRESFWKFVEEAGAVRVHFDQAYEVARDGSNTRHRAVDIDVERLLGHDGFEASVREELSQLPKPDCVLIPQHECTSALKEMVIRAFGIGEKQIHAVPRAGALGEAGKAARTAKIVLVVDDMIVTGMTMAGIIGRLKKTCGEERFSQIRCHGFVLLDCSPIRDVQKETHNKFTTGDGERLFKEAFRVYLPPHANCPWCVELDKLERADSLLRGGHGEFLDKRIAELRGDGPLEQLSPVSVAPQAIFGSAIGEAKASTVFAAWSSATQELRGNPEVEGLREEETYLDLSHVLGWADWCQCAGVLRTATEGEVRFLGQEPAFADAWEKNEEHLDDAKLVEFAWAAVLEKLTPASAEQVLATLVDRDSVDPGLVAIGTLLRLKLQEPDSAQAA